MINKLGKNTEGLELYISSKQVTTPDNEYSFGHFPDFISLQTPKKLTN